MFTETYIEMVTKAKEIQDLWKPKKGDYIYSKEDNQICLIYHYCFSKSNKKLIFYEYINNSMHAWDDEEIIKTKHKWLPTLEDLFNLLEGKPIEDTWYFYKWIATENQKFTWVNTDKQSIKELLLHYVMFDKFNKSWNPEKKEWREINGS